MNQQPPEKNPFSFDELAALLNANGIQPQVQDSDKDYEIKIEVWNDKNGRQHFSKEEIDFLRSNIKRVRFRVDKNILLRKGLVAIGQGGKWIYTLHSCITKAKSWGSLVQATAKYNPYQLARISFAKTIASQSMWWITAGITAIQIGVQFKNWYFNRITGKQFWINVSKRIFANVLAMAGAACGASIGAAIGMCIGPVGAIVGIIVGGLAGSITVTYLAQKIVAKFEEKYKNYSPDALISEALNFFELPDLGLSQDLLLRTKKAKISLYHPDKWKREEQQRRKEAGENFSKAQMYYQILKTYLERRNQDSDAELQRQS